MTRQCFWALSLLPLLVLGAAGCYDFDSLSTEFHGDSGTRDMVFVFPSKCANKIKDGDETDVDCGGSCKPCGGGLHCIHAADCLSGTCANNACAATMACSDGIKDGNETDIDCGGGTCAACANGKACLHAGDCLSATCANTICVQ